MNKALFALLFCLYTTLFAQVINITYPKEIDTYPGQILNVPIVIENISNQTITVFPDYFNSETMSIEPFPINNLPNALATILSSADPPYRLSYTAPKEINPGRKELLFLSLIPANNLIAGIRTFPFTIKDARFQVLEQGMLEISHIIHQELDIISLSDDTFIIPNTDYALSYLVINKGSIPVEFKTADYKHSHIVQPGSADTLSLKLSQINGVERNDYWVGINLDYLVTKVKPDTLEVERHRLSRHIPVALQTSYPRKKEYFKFPLNFSYGYTYSEAHRATYQRSSQRHRARIWGRGYTDDFPAPYLAYNLEYRRNEYDYTSETDEEITGYFLYRSENLAFRVGDGSYMLDLKRSEKWGTGFDFSLKLKKLLLEKTFVKEEYGERAVHNSVSLGYVWDANSSLYEPQQYLRIRHYVRNHRAIGDDWYNPYGHKTSDNKPTTEHQKLIIDTQIKLFNKLRLHLELYTAKNEVQTDPDKKGWNLTEPALTTELVANFRYLNNRLFVQRDNLNVFNEHKYRNLYQDDLNLKTSWLQIDLSGYRHEEYTPANALTYSDYEYESQNLSADFALKLFRPIHIRAKGFDAYTKSFTYLQAGNTNEIEIKDREYLGGLMIKSEVFRLEALGGMKEESYYTLYDRTPTQFDTKYYLGEFNIGITTRNSQNHQIYFNNRALQKDDEIDKELTVFSQLNIYSRYTPSFTHIWGFNNVYYSEDDWKNIASVYSDFYFRLKWNHDLRLRGMFQINPYYRENYNYSIFAEYAMPLSFPIMPKSNRRYMNISVYDPWQRKPVSGAVFEIDRRYFVTNDDGMIRTRKSMVTGKPVRIMNLPAEFTITPDISTLSNLKKNKITLQIVNLSTLKINVNKLTYDPIAPNEVDNYQNIAYFQNKLVNKDKSSLTTCTDPVEIILTNSQNKTDTRRAMVNASGFVLFTHLLPGQYEISINTNMNNDYILETAPEQNIITISPNKNQETDIIVKENITEFIKYEK